MSYLTESAKKQCEVSKVTGNAKFRERRNYKLNGCKPCIKHICIVLSVKRQTRFHIKGPLCNISKGLHKEWSNCQEAAILLYHISSSE